MNILQLIHSLLPLEGDEILPSQIELTAWEGEMRITIMMREQLYGTPAVVLLVDSIGDGLKVFQREGSYTLDNDLRRLQRMHSWRWLVQQIIANAIGVSEISPITVKEIHRWSNTDRRHVIEYPTDMIATLS